MDVVIGFTSTMAVGLAPGRSLPVIEVAGLIGVAGLTETAGLTGMAGLIDTVGLMGTAGFTDTSGLIETAGFV